MDRTESKGLVAVLQALQDYYDFKPSLGKDHYEEGLMMTAQRLALLKQRVLGRSHQAQKVVKQGQRIFMTTLPIYDVQTQIPDANVEEKPFISQNAVMLTKDDVWSDDDDQPKKKKIRAFKIKSVDSQEQP